MSMDKRMILNGPGTYFFTVHGVKNTPLFRSIFEYEYFIKILAQEEDCQLIAYAFSEYQASWVMHCEQDWQIILDNIRSQMQELHFKLWHKHQQIISESADVIFIEEDRYLVPLVMELHHWPVRHGLVVSPDVYPWSSDQYYRDYAQPSWLASHRMLKRMSKQRTNTGLRYERMMEQFTPLDIDESKNHLYQALASNAYITQHLRKKEQPTKLSKEQIVNMRGQAEKLICDFLGAPIDQVRYPRFRRQYYQVEPLTVWLLLQNNCTIDQLTAIFDLDKIVIQGWLRSLSNQHPESFLTRIQQSWQEHLHTKEPSALSEIS